MLLWPLSESRAGERRQVCWLRSRHPVSWHHHPSNTLGFGSFWSLMVIRFPQLDLLTCGLILFKVSNLCSVSPSSGLWIRPSKFSLVVSYEIRLTTRTAIPPKRIYSYIKNFMQIIIPVLFITGKRCKQPKCPSTSEWIGCHAFTWWTTIQQ